MLKMLLILSTLGLLQLSCSFCNRVRCDGNAGNIEIRLTRNGVNALYGPDAFLNKDSIRLFNTTINRYDTEFLRFPESTQSIQLNLHNEINYYLEIDTLQTDTLYLTTEILSIGECCKAYQIHTVSINGVIICSSPCDEVIDIEI